jgi:hypothetical protein
MTLIHYSPSSTMFVAMHLLKSNDAKNWHFDAAE